MDAEKKERVFYASVVTAIVVLLLLLGISLFQRIRITNKQRQLSSLKREIKVLELELSECEDDIRKWQLEEAIREKAMRLGYIEGDSK